MRKVLLTASLLVVGQVSAGAGDLALPGPHHSRYAAYKVRHMHYYDPYPWWWHQPYVARARTNYIKWQNTYYERPYDLPHPDGVVGYTVIGPLTW